ncbi:MAG: tetratricopeptide repeat protein [Cyclobacteriaceae bacterium]|nr:tetratricopeptide repeat protein [Cyclobacteriaceae bacterium]
MAITALAQNLAEIQLADQYAAQGENAKAISIYEKLEKNSKNIPQIHERYFQLLLITGEFDKAEKYVDKAIKQYPTNLFYQIDKGLIYVQLNEKQQAKKYYDGLISAWSDDPFKVRVAAQHFIRLQQYDNAIDIYKQSRKKLNNPYEYSIQLASIYRIANKQVEMIEEYLNYLHESQNSVASIKNIMQNILIEDQDLELFENIMYAKIQEQPENIQYSELLIWVNLQRKNFYSAFIQARAIDKRMNLMGTELMDIGRIAIENKDFKNSLRIYTYVIDEYPQTPNYQIARRMAIYCREELVKNTYPVNTTEINILINDYKNLIAELGLNQYTAEAMRSEAYLYAFYIGNHDQAIQLLQTLIRSSNISKPIIDQAKLDLGDIYLLTGEPWEATLLYSQVEKSSKETPIGYEAKLRNAKLNYYNGEFELAQGHLDILKLATTREISNDAMALSLLIKDNYTKDSSDNALKRYADIELLIFKNRKDKAYALLDQLKNDYPLHPLQDEILYKQALLSMEMGNFSKALIALNEIVDKYGTDILGDDALFLCGTVTEEYLHDKSAAMEIYQSFLVKYPGSNHAADARKRFRQLRGDTL